MCPVMDGFQSLEGYWAGYLEGPGCDGNCPQGSYLRKAGSPDAWCEDMRLGVYRSRIWHQFRWTNRARDNRCRPRITLDEFTRTPLRSVAPTSRHERVVKAKAKHHRAQAKTSLCVPTNPRAVIRYVFGAYGDQAVAVASCETGGTFNVYATNGQYWGLFQMGEYARARYGHSWTALGQSQSAYAYFRDSGSDWSPWQCRPWGLGW